MKKIILFFFLLFVTISTAFADNKETMYYYCMGDEKFQRDMYDLYRVGTNPDFCSCYASTYMNKFYPYKDTYMDIDYYNQTARMNPSGIKKLKEIILNCS
ncbi:hypothetical protein N9T64_00755 [Pelagibacteraceae bacterium]|nr:hypothetical protein [Pelagibacteraceae bacterium]